MKSNYISYAGSALYGILTFDGQIKTTQPVTWQRVRPALQDNCARLERLHHFGYHLNKKLVVTRSPQGSVTATQRCPCQQVTRGHPWCAHSCWIPDIGNSEALTKSSLLTTGCDCEGGIQPAKGRIAEKGIILPKEQLHEPPSDKAWSTKSHSAKMSSLTGLNIAS